LLSTPLALEFVSVTVILMNASALSAPLAHILWIHRIHEHTVFFWLVLDELFELTEFPY